jgi:hypothetical protein
MNASVSAILVESHGITAQPGAKVECPFCHHTTFSTKRDGSATQVMRAGKHCFVTL